MKRGSFMRLRLRAAIGISVLFLLASCVKQDSRPWPSVPDDADLARAAERSLDPALASVRASLKRRRERSRLLFLQGQVFAARWFASRQSGARADLRPDYAEAAIGAFERVVDLDVLLVDEARNNIEVLATSLATSLAADQQADPQSSDDQQQSGDQQQDGDQQSGDEKQEGSQPQEGGGKDQQNSKQQDGPQQADEKSGDKDQDSADAGGAESTGGAEPTESAGGAEGDGEEAPRDLSALVRDREAGGALEEARERALERVLLREQERREEEAGSLTPVAEDW